MKQLFLVGISLLVVATCASPPNAAAQEASATNTTNYYDGKYVGNFVTITHPTGNTSECPVFNVAPALTIKNGTAQFSASNIMFHGYVTPQGELIMHSDTGPNLCRTIRSLLCTQRSGNREMFYDASWEKYKKQP